MIDAIKDNAKNYYVNGEFLCAEAVLKAVLEGFDVPISHETIAMSSGFPGGIGSSGCTCGALSGGVMAIGYFFGRSQPKGSEVGKTLRMSKELHDIFKAKNRITCCRGLIKGLEKGGVEHKAQCARITAEMAEETAKLIIQNR